MISARTVNAIRYDAPNGSRVGRIGVTTVVQKPPMRAKSKMRLWIRPARE